MTEQELQKMDQEADITLAAQGSVDVCKYPDCFDRAAELGFCRRHAPKDHKDRRPA